MNMSEWHKKYACKEWVQVVKAPNGKWYRITFNQDGTFSYGTPFDSEEEAEKYSWMM